MLGKCYYSINRFRGKSEKSEIILSGALFETKSSTTTTDLADDVAGFEAPRLSSNSANNLRHFIEDGTVTSTITDSDLT